MMEVKFQKGTVNLFFLRNCSGLKSRRLSQFHSVVLTQHIRFTRIFLMSNVG